MWNEVTTAQRPVVVGIDGRPSGETALGWAVEAARLHRLPLRVVLVADVPELPRYVPYTPPEDGETFIVPARPARHPSDDDLDRALAYARLRLPPGAVTGRRAPGHAARALIEDSAEAAMLVVGSRRRGALAAAALGSVSATVAARASCPVVVVGAVPPPGPADRPIVVGLADDRAAGGVLDFAFAEAAVRGAPLTVVHCGPAALGEPRRPGDHFSGMLPALAAQLATFAARYPTVPVTSHLSAAHPAADLIMVSADAELLVVGSRGRGRVLGLMLGSVSQELVHEARCPVAVVHPSRLRTPQRVATVAVRPATS